MVRLNQTSKCMRVQSYLILQLFGPTRAFAVQSGTIFYSISNVKLTKTNLNVVGYIVPHFRWRRQVSKQISNLIQLNADGIEFC